MRKILIFSFTLLSYSLLGQPNFRVENYTVDSDKKAGFYNNESNRAFKTGDYNVAVLNAATALKLSTKKGQISEAQQRLMDSYDRAVQENLARIDLLKINSMTFTNDQTVTDRAIIVSLYKVMVEYNSILKLLPKSSFDPVKKKDPKLVLDIVDFMPDLKVAMEQLELGKTEGAAWHYQQGRDLGRSSELESNKAAAYHYKWAMEYVPGYEDCEKRYNDARVLGTTRMGVMSFETSYQVRSYGDLGSMASDEFIAKMPNNYEFFELVSRDKLDLVIREQQLNISGLMDESSTAEVGQLKGVNVLLVGKLNSASQDRQEGGGATTYKEESQVEDGEEKYIDSSGKEKTRKKYKTVEAYVKFYYRSASGNVTGSYKILDVKTGGITDANTVVGNYTWKHEWATYTGDKRALSSRSASLVNQGPVDYPPANQVVISANQNLVDDLVSQIQRFAQQVGF